MVHPKFQLRNTDLKPHWLQNLKLTSITHWFLQNGRCPFDRHCPKATQLLSSEKSYGVWAKLTCMHMHFNSQKSNIWQYWNMCRYCINQLAYAKHRQQLLATGRGANLSRLPVSTSPWLANATQEAKYATLLKMKSFERVFSIMMLQAFLIRSVEDISTISSQLLSNSNMHTTS